MPADSQELSISRQGDSARTKVEQPKPHIVALTHEFFPQVGGIATYTHEVARAAVRRGLPIEVWAPGCPEIRDGCLEFPVRELPAHGDQGWPSRLKLAARLISTRENWKDSVLWLPEPGPMRTMMYFTLFQAMPVRGLVLTLHGSEISRFSSCWHRRKLFGRLLHCADRIGVVSRFGRDSLLSHFPEVAPKVCIANGALRSDVRGLETPVSGAIKGDRIAILTVGRIHPRKGQMAVIEALAMMEPRLRNRFVYRCVGPVRRPTYLRDLGLAAEKAGIAFEYLGELSTQELNAQYERADIFAMTSEQNGHSVEGFGLTYLEASAYGLPIVAHRTGGVGDAVRDGFNGLKVEPDDRIALCSALEALAKDRSLRTRLGENGRSWARQFSWDDASHTLFDGLGQTSRAPQPSALMSAFAGMF
jgi:glycosyltransferase involved in cell wall biosynthesis